MKSCRWSTGTCWLLFCLRKRFCSLSNCGFMNCRPCLSVALPIWFYNGACILLHFLKSIWCLQIDLPYKHPLPLLIRSASNDQPMLPSFHTLLTLLTPRHSPASLASCSTFPLPPSSQRYWVPGGTTPRAVPVAAHPLKAGGPAGLGDAPRCLPLGIDGDVGAASSGRCLGKGKETCSVS